MSLVVLDEVTLFFGDRMIFDAASLRLGHGDRIGLIGPNGSGKTTLLKIIAGEQEVDDGKVTIANGVVWVRCSSTYAFISRMSSGVT